MSAVTELRAALPLRAALAVAVALAGLTAATALVVRIAAAAQARRLLGFGFDGVPADVATAAGILVNNARVLGALVAACVAVQLGRRQPDDGLPGVLLATITAMCDGAVAIGAALHVGLVGAAFGAYGTRTLGATLTHGPVELAAFALVLGLYVTARRRPVAVRTTAVTALTALALLALAALLEAFA